MLLLRKCCIDAVIAPNVLTPIFVLTDSVTEIPIHFSYSQSKDETMNIMKS